MKQNKPRVAIQGIRASFHEEAAFRYFGENIETVECGSFKQTFDALQNNQADYVVMAIENSIAGSILPNYSLLLNYNFPVVGEVYLPIQLHLMALPGVAFEDIKYVTSHPIAIRQCVDFFDEYPHLKIVESSDTAACAKRIRDEQLTDFQVSNQVGSLAKVLNIFANLGVNMSKIQSMPVLGKPSEYNFYVDVEWEETKHYDAAVKQILKYTHNFNILGEYMRHEDDPGAEKTPALSTEKAPKKYINIQKREPAESGEAKRPATKK